ncbi:MAG TPA: sigma-70 family RNA polymerase sigma factor, partial [Pseudonocardiaceae bacterium]
RGGTPAGPGARRSRPPADGRHPSELERLRHVAFARCRAAGASPEDAQDCAQDALTALLEHPEVHHPDAWVATVAHHRFIDLCRRRRREDSAGLVPAPATALVEAGPEDEVVGRAHAHWLVTTLRRLPLSTRSVCAAIGDTAAAGDAPDHREVARRLGLSARSVESHLTRARRSLRGLGLLGSAALAFAAATRRLGLLAKPAAAAIVVPPAALVIALTPADRSTDAALGPVTVHPTSDGPATSSVRAGRPPTAPPSSYAGPLPPAGLVADTPDTDPGGHDREPEHENDAAGTQPGRPDDPRGTDRRPTALPTPGPARPGRPLPPAVPDPPANENRNENGSGGGNGNAGPPPEPPAAPPADPPAPKPPGGR